ncbi:hypothetical protein NQ156_08160 [Microbacterium sp. zg.Y625]|uniref:hypothetical protein n=1 Tax=Microbacterium jiangjiandongii TaxID=3049071 RepID=UPI00214C2125|nr:MULTISPECIES: hypothetical protein [unclassified Microbacterium]MCR2793029.1 hypothetical protein [Microbacterium sp. zg.Y625]MCR2814329.1 hypothetical protein [Microbacterium sp. zg.Y843]WIM24145.1 hypothetical protein QNO14_08185 [Microbacterium sp. zg-Y625]
MRTTRIVIVIVIALGWVIAAGGLITSFVDLAALPAFARSALGLWPDAGTSAALVVRFGSIGVVVAGIVSLRVLGKMRERQVQAQADAAGRGILTGTNRDADG